MLLCTKGAHNFGPTSACGRMNCMLFNTTMNKDNCPFLAKCKRATTHKVPLCTVNQVYLAREWRNILCRVAAVITIHEKRKMQQ